jgi:hypothetical protein
VDTASRNAVKLAGICRLQTAVRPSVLALVNRDRGKTQKLSDYVVPVPDRQGHRHTTNRGAVKHIPKIAENEEYSSA